MNHVRITSKADGAGTIDIDGIDVANSVHALQLNAGVGEMTRLELDVHPRRVAEFEGAAFVRLQPDFEEFLIKLGWTPPRRP